MKKALALSMALAMSAAMLAGWLRLRQHLRFRRCFLCR